MKHIKSSIEKKSIVVPKFFSPVSAGFPSPAEDYIEQHLDLNKHLIKHPEATFFVQVDGDSMTGGGIRSKDILIIDRSLKPSNGTVVVALVGGEFTVKRLQKRTGKIFLVPENSRYRPIEITAEMDFEIWGVVTYVIHKL